MSAHVWPNDPVRSAMPKHSVARFAIVASRFLKLVGYGTFSMVDGRVRVKAFDMLCLLLNLSAGVVMFYIAYQYTIHRLPESSALVNLGIILTMNGSSAITIISMFCVFHRREQIWELVLLLDVVSSRFERIKVDPDFRLYMIVFGVGALLFLLLIILGLSLMFFCLGYSNKIGILIMYAYVSTNFSASMGWIAMFFLAVFVRLRLMNRTIRFGYLELANLRMLI